MKPAIALTLAVLVCGAAACSDDKEPARATGPDYEAPPAAMSPIEPGRYAFAALGDQAEALPLTVVDVPAGFVADSSFLLLASPDNDAVPADDASFTAFSVWAVSGVYPDGCHDLDSPRLVAARSVKQVAGLLHHEPGMRVSAPTPASIDGHDGLYLEFTTGNIDYAKCNGGSFAFFEADPGTAHVEIPGILERWWVVDLDGTPVIVGTAAGPKATHAQAEAIKAIAEATEFVSR
ncbi:MAG: hypothetical protein JWO11_550 [Nocardioides sp.]|nr:hypothetical protein [Nocardioides sp.]